MKIFYKASVSTKNRLYCSSNATTCINVGEIKDTSSGYCTRFLLIFVDPKGIPSNKDIEHEI